jgi:hypothetical protein
VSDPRGGTPNGGWLADRRARAIAASVLFGLSLLAGGGLALLTSPGSTASTTDPSLPPAASASANRLPSDPVPPTSDPSSLTPGPSLTPSPTPTPPSKAELEQAALDRLTKQADEDLDQTSFRGQWVAQLSSKFVGVRDPRQRSSSGSHTFRAVDIWAEHSALRKRFGQDYDVRLLRGEDFGSHNTHDGDSFWYTFVLGDFSSRSDVESFCASAFPQLSGADLENQCLPRTLKP